MDKKSKSSPLVGASSLLVIFAVLCLTVFALLSLSSMQASQRLRDSSAAAVSAYYEADCAAEEIFARLRGGEMPAGVSADGDSYSYSCKISETQELSVLLRKDEGGWTVLRWQSLSTAKWEPDDSIPVWDGN